MKGRTGGDGIETAGLWLGTTSLTGSSLIFLAADAISEVMNL
jgi:hypothetical protein